LSNYILDNEILTDEELIEFESLNDNKGICEPDGFFLENY
jgi:hypothetical protein